MNEKVIDVVRRYAAERGQASRVLLVDDQPEGVSGAARFSDTGFDPSEMWACGGDGALTLAVMSAPRSAREMLRVLCLVERLIAPDGKVLLLPNAEEASAEVRPEATELFCGAYPEWARRQVEADVVELYRRQPQYFSDEPRVLRADAAPSPTDSARVAEIPDAGGERPIAPARLALGLRVVSLSVFGDCRFGTDFWKQMPEFVVNYALAHHAIFPGYELRIHHDEHIYHANGGDVILGLARRGLVKLVYAPPRAGQGKCERMLHRLMPAWDPEVEIVVCRDVDSLPTWRDRQAVEQWAMTGLAVGVVHDNPEHGWVMGGLSHFRADALRAAFSSFEAFIIAAGKSDEEWSKHGADQDHLLHVVREHLRGGVLEHSLRSRGVQTIAGSRFLTSIEPPSDDVVAEVPEAVRHGSDALTNYMGSSGYSTQLARAFYDNHSPIATQVKEVEEFARAPLAAGEGVIVDRMDKFLSGVDDWCNHRPLLWLALEATGGSASPVLEMGMGHGSTPYLHDYCEASGRNLVSRDSDGSWVEKFVHLRSESHSIAGVGQEWELVHDGTRWSVALVDHAPGERRYIDVERLAHSCDIIVIHDSEPEASGYGLHNIWHLFKYRVDVQSRGAWATAVSNVCDVTAWRGRHLGGYVIS